MIVSLDASLHKHERTGVSPGGGAGARAYIEFDQTVKDFGSILSRQRGGWISSSGARAYILSSEQHKIKDLFHDMCLSSVRRITLTCLSMQ